MEDRHDQRDDGADPGRDGQREAAGDVPVVVCALLTEVERGGDHDRPHREIHRAGPQRQAGTDAQQSVHRDQSQQSADGEAVEMRSRLLVHRHDETSRGEQQHDLDDRVHAEAVAAGLAVLRIVERVVQLNRRWREGHVGRRRQGKRRARRQPGSGLTDITGR